MFCISRILLQRPVSMLYIHGMFYANLELWLYEVINSVSFYHCVIKYSGGI
jgi:hypothetical protein